MSEERQLMEGISRANRAAELLASPLYLEAITVMKAAMFEEFESTKLDTPEVRHELWQRMQLMKQFQGRFESIVKYGDKAKQKLGLLDKAKQKFNIL